MFFKSYNIYENKLSEQLSDDNPYKKKLIQMETPSEKHPIYFFLIYGLYLYCLLFFAVILFSKSYGYEICIIVIFWMTCCLYFTKGKNYLILSKKAHFFILSSAVIMSIFLEILDKQSIPFSSIGKLFLFFIEINQKSYLALSILAFFTVGLSLCYTESIDKGYEHFTNFQQKNKRGLSMVDIVNANYDFAVVLSLIFPYFIYLALDDAQDIFRQNIKLLSLVVFLEMPPYIYRSFIVKRYFTLFIKAQKFKQRRIL